MKRPKIIILSTLILLGSGCESFLENIDPPISKILSSTVFADDLMATSAVAGIYAKMYGKQGFASGERGSIPALGGLSADELSNFTSSLGFLEIEYNEIVNTNSSTYELWRSLYTCIYGANAALEGLSNSSGVTTEVKNQLLGEVLFIRAFCNFYLVNLFGNVPLVTTTDYRLNSVIQRSERDLVYQQIVDDLLHAKDLLSSEYPSIERVRPNKATSMALLSRVYLYLEEWQNAELEATKIIDYSNLYELTPLDEAFLKNGREAIWQFSPLADKINTTEGNMFIAFPYFTLTDTLLNSFELADNRSIKWTGSSGPRHYPHKYKQYLQPAPNVTEYSMVFRLAEQHLIRAEARARQNNLTGSNSAASDLNMIRHRAGLSDLPGEVDTEEEMMLAIEYERKVELFTEWGHRWFDLKRWGRAIEVLGPQKEHLTEADLLYPIPQQEIDINPRLTQNPGY